MTRYATSTPEARELIAELSFVWDQIKNMSPQQSSASEEESSPLRRVRKVPSRGDGLLELEPKSEESRDWEVGVFTDGEGSTDTRSDKRFRRRVNRAIDALKVDVAGLREELEMLRLRGGRPARRDGILWTLGRWIFRFVGVRLSWDC
jgi:hypothetical protein